MSHRSGDEVIRDLWLARGLPEAALQTLVLTGREPALPSSFAVGTAAQAAIAASALAAGEVWYERTGRRQQVSIDMKDAAAECTGYFTLDGRQPEAWAKLSGLYPCGAEAGQPGWVRIHANFAHHRDAALTTLGLPGDSASRQDVERALAHWRAEAFESAAVETGAVVAAMRDFTEWDQHPQARAVAELPLIAVERLGDAEPRPWARSGPALTAPLDGIRVLDLTRILAGPVGGRTLAAYGAEVLLVNAPYLPNIEAIADTSRGKRSAHVDLASTSGREVMRALVEGADVCLLGYRPGALDALGFSPSDLARRHPGIVVVTLSAWGHAGPWANRRGFDSIVQTAAGFNRAEGEAAGVERPKALPVQILDFASGFLMAFAAQAALLGQRREGGSWHVRVALARTAHWLRGLGRLDRGFAAPSPDLEGRLESYVSGFGTLRALPHAARFSETPARWRLPSVPPGTHPPRWMG